MADPESAIIAECRRGFLEFHDALVGFYEDQGGMPHEQSQANEERVACASQRDLVTSWTFATLLMDSVGEHATAFVRAITEPLLPLACWTAVRSSLEASALIVWLLDPAIDAKTRIGRKMALRYEGMSQQLTYLRSGPHTPEQATDLEAHIDRMESEALRLGYTRLIDRRRRRIGIGQVMPGSTHLIRDALDEETMYRLLSAIAHGHSWAISTLGYVMVPGEAAKIVVGDQKLATMQKRASVAGIRYLAAGLARAFGKAAWYQSRYYGWDVSRMVAILETLAATLGIKPEARCWRG